jgi:hypothetical protein
METTDLINFDEVYEHQQPTIYSLEQELFETKRKLSLLEERINKLEEEKSQSFSVIPFKFDSPFNNRRDWIFCDINCSSIKIDMFHIYFNDCKLFDIKDFIQNQYCFLKQFQNIKLIEIDRFPILINTSSHLYTCTETDSTMYRRHDGSYYTSISHENYISLITTLLSVYKDIEIIFKSPNLYPEGSSKTYLIFKEFMKSTNYRKLHIEIKDNLTVNRQNGGVSYVSQPYVNETKEHCIRNNIEFTSNIGL